MVEDIRWKQRFDNFQRALGQLTLAIELMARRPLTDLERQGLIQGFEFTHELAWNVLNLTVSQVMIDCSAAWTSHELSCDACCDEVAQ